MKLTILGKPLAKKRPRFTRRGKHVITYNSQKDEMDYTKAVIKSQYSGKPLSGALSCSIIFYMPTPKSRKGEHWHCIRPDIDNLEKFIFDCLNGIVWIDDCQVSEVYKRKIYSDNPRTEITIDKLYGWNDDMEIIT